MIIVFKLPGPFVERYGETLREFDWGRTPRVMLGEIIPAEPALGQIVLEAVPDNDRTIIRSATPGSMLRLRNFSDRLVAKQIASDVVQVQRPMPPQNPGEPPMTPNVRGLASLTAKFRHNLDSHANRFAKALADKDAKVAAAVDEAIAAVDAAVDPQIAELQAAVSGTDGSNGGPTDESSPAT